MSTKYGRVTQPDRIPISTPADAHEYRDDINANGYNTKGNGIYNDPVYTVEVTPKTYRDTFRIACFRCQNTRRNKFMLIGGFLVVALVFILIIVAATSHSESDDAQQTVTGKVRGLIAYGPDADGFIRFNPTDSKTYLDELNRIEAQMYTYNTLDQVSNLNEYIRCEDNTTSVPDTKMCMLTASQFGNRCQQFDMYGLGSGQPCVLLVLKLNKGEIPVPLDTYNDAVPPEHYSNQSVSVSCAGKTPADDIALGITSGNKFQGPPVEYHPVKGFPLYYFRLRNNNKNWIHPAVMVQFNDVETHKEITVKCTAWAQNFNDGQPQNSPIYSTEFKLNIFNN